MMFACGVSIDWTSCSLTTLRETADEGFNMVRMALAEPRFDRGPVECAKRELSVSLRQGDADPKMLASRAMNDALIPGHPYARQATPETVGRVSRSDIAMLKHTLMTRDRLLVVAVGEMSADELEPKLDEMFGALPAGAPLAPLADAVARHALSEPVVKQLAQPQTLVMFSGPGVPREDPDFFAAYLPNYILGGDALSSRLGDDLREKRGLTYGVGTGLSLQTHFWRWTGSTSVLNGKAEDAVALIRENIGRLGRDGPTQAELNDAMAYVTGAFPLAFDSNASIARNHLGFQQDNLAADYVHQRNAYFEAVTLADVKRVAEEYMKPDQFTFVMVGQPALD